jgi:tetratricopeptide (TPR) repeat protein
LTSRVLPSSLSVENLVELRALMNMLRMAGGFALGFGRVNHPSLKDRLITEIRRQLPGKDIVELRVDPGGEAGLLAQWEQAVGGRRPDALFVHGLESLFDLAGGKSPEVDVFNFNRDYVRRRFPWPVVFWASEFAIREFARRAPDFWSGRSGIYRFVGDEEEARETLELLGRDFDWSLSPKERKERRAVLQDLVREIESAPEPDPAALAEARYALGQAALYDSEWAEARLLFEQALPLYRQIGARRGEANAIKSLGDVALAQARYGEAAALYEQALPLYRQIGARLGEANAIKSLGDVARMQDRYGEAAALYEQALPLYRQIGARLGEANAIQSLGDVARMQDRYGEAAALYEQALPLYRQIGARLGEANTLLAQARLGRATGDTDQARAAYREAQRIYTAIGLTHWAEVAANEAKQISP